MTFRQSCSTEPLESRTLLSDVRLLADFNPTPAGAEPNQMTTLGDVAIYGGKLDQTQQAIWATDGTPRGTRVIANAVAGLIPRDGVSIVSGRVLFFTADDGVHGMELWRTDGMRPGTRIVSDITPGAIGTSIREITSIGREVVFIVSTGSTNELWRSDGSATGTSKLADLGYFALASSSAVLNGLFYLVAARTASGQPVELWRSDGTTPGTFTLSIDLGTGPADAEIVSAGGKLFISVGNHLYVGDGSAAGTTLLHTFSDASNLYNLREVNGQAYFDLILPGGHEVWRSDGTQVGTIPVDPGHFHMNGFLGSINSKLLFVGDAIYNGPYAPEDVPLYSLDAVSLQTTELYRFSYQPYEWPVAGAAALNSRIYFGAKDPEHGRELWVTDGTAAGTHITTDLRAGPESAISNPAFTPLKDRLILAADNGSSGDEAYVYRPDRSSLQLLQDVRGTQSADATPLLVVAKDLYFTTVEDTAYRTLWKTDGTAAGTLKLREHIAQPTEGVSFGGIFYFITANTLWKSDGTAAGTQKVYGDSGNMPWAVHVAVANGKLFFATYKSGTYPYSGFYEYSLLYVIDTPGGEINLNALSDMGNVPSNLLVVNDRVYFVASYYGHPNTYVWRVTDGVTVTDLGPNWPFPQPIPSLPPFPPFSDSITIDSMRYYAFDDGKHGVELWSDDGKHQKLVDDIYKGPHSSFPDGLALVNGQLIFAAITPETGRELFILPLHLSRPLLTRDPFMAIASDDLVADVLQ